LRAKRRGIVTDLKDKQIDYGNVAFSRRHRYLSTFLYQLPFGNQGMKGANSWWTTSLADGRLAAC